MDLRALIGSRQLAGSAGPSLHSRVRLPGFREEKAEKLRCGGEGQNRTADTAIFSRVLYQLSYLAGIIPG